MDLWDLVPEFALKTNVFVRVIDITAVTYPFACYEDLPTDGNGYVVFGEVQRRLLTIVDILRPAEDAPVDNIGRDVEGTTLQGRDLLPERDVVHQVLHSGFLRP